MKRKTISGLLVIILAISMLMLCLGMFASASENSASEGNGVSTLAYEPTGEWLANSPNDLIDYSYSFAIVGDTQAIVKNDVANGTTYTQTLYDWIVANIDSKKIEYVLGLGDITENNTDEEWIYAKAQIQKLDGKLPYLLNRGNSPHDSVAQLNKYFASESDYTDNIVGYFKDGSIENVYTKVTAGSTKWLIFALDFGPSDAVLEWAGNVISNNPDHKVIITTHSYLYRDGTTLDAGDTAPPNSTGSNDGARNNGDQMWEKLVRKHQNIVLVLCGHDPSADIIWTQSVGDNGNTVTQMLIDPQNMDPKYNYETGMVAMLYFSEDGSKVSVEWISTVREQYYKASNQFTLSLTEAKTDVQTAYGIAPAQYADPIEYPFVMFKKAADGKGNDYTFFAACSALMTDSNLGVSANNDMAYHGLRSAATAELFLCAATMSIPERQATPISATMPEQVHSTLEASSL